MNFLKKHYNYFLIASVNFLLTFINWVDTEDGYGKAWDGSYSFYGFTFPCILFFIISVIIILVKFKEFVETKKFFIAEITLATMQLLLIILFIYIIAVNRDFYYNLGIIGSSGMAVFQMAITLKKNKNKGR